MTEPSVAAVDFLAYNKPGAEAPGRHRRVQLPCGNDLTAQRYTLAEARQLLDDIMRDQGYRQTLLGPHIVDFLAYKQVEGITDVTYLNYEWELGHLCKAWPAVPIDQITGRHLLHAITRIPPKSQRRRRAVYNEFFRYARLMRLTAENPMETVPRIKPLPRKVIDVFSDAERAALEGLPLIDGALMRILFACGIRAGEARRLRYRDIRPEPWPGQLAVLSGKGGKGRLIEIGEETARMVAELALLEGLEPTDHLWYLRPGGHHIRRDRPIGETALKRWWSRCLDQAGVRYRNMHVTRHTFATTWLRNGGRMATLKDQLGHASIRTTIDEYEHLDTNDARADLTLVEGIRA